MVFCKLLKNVQIVCEESLYPFLVNLPYVICWSTPFSNEEVINSLNYHLQNLIQVFGKYCSTFRRMYIINGDNIDSTETKIVDNLFKVNNTDAKTSSMVNVTVLFSAFEQIFASLQ